MGWRDILDIFFKRAAKQFLNFTLTKCPRSSDPFQTVSYYINWVTTSWTHSSVFSSAFQYIQYTKCLGMYWGQKACRRVLGERSSYCNILCLVREIYLVNPACILLDNFDILLHFYGRNIVSMVKCLSYCCTFTYVYNIL